MQVDFKLNLGDRVRCFRTGLSGVVEGFAVYSDGTMGVCIAYTDTTGVMHQQWRQLATVEAVA